jgi:hypothetical protein
VKALAEVMSNHRKQNESPMKIKTLLDSGYVIAGAMALSMFSVQTILAADATTTTTTTTPKTPPVEVPRSGNDHADNRALNNVNVPVEIKKLISDFDGTRDAYLAKQKEILKGAADRETIRAELQKNRAAFLAELKTFRDTLKQDLQDLKVKINHQEFNRIVDAARDAATDRPGRKGQR